MPSFETRNSHKDASGRACTRLASQALEKHVNLRLAILVSAFTPQAKAGSDMQFGSEHASLPSSPSGPCYVLALADAQKGVQSTSKRKPGHYVSSIFREYLALRSKPGAVSSSDTLCLRMAIPTSKAQVSRTSGYDPKLYAQTCTMGNRFLHIPTQDATIVHCSGQATLPESHAMNSSCRGCQLSMG